MNIPTTHIGEVIMVRATKLLKPETVKFDASNPEHRKAYIDFLNNRKWPIRFELEWPFTNLPQMCMFLLAAKACEKDGELNLQAVLQAAVIPIAQDEGQVTILKKVA